MNGELPPRTFEEMVELLDDLNASLVCRGRGPAADAAPNSGEHKHFAYLENLYEAPKCSLLPVSSLIECRQRQPNTDL